VKTVYVRAKTKDEARKRAEWLYMILRDCTPVIADLCTSKAQVVTESMVIKYVSENYTMDGIRCDIAIGFGQLGKIIATGNTRDDLMDERELAKYIVDNETISENENIECKGWKELIAGAIDNAYEKMIASTPPQTEEEKTHCEMIKEAVKGMFINESRTAAEAEFIKTHIVDYEKIFDVCMNGDDLEFKKGLVRLQKMQNEYVMQREREETANE